VSACCTRALTRRQTWKPQIEYGLLTDRDGRPIAVEVFTGNTGDPSAFIEAVRSVRERFGLEEITFVGDSPMITKARIVALSKLPGASWITALRAPDIKALVSSAGASRRGRRHLDE